MNNIIGKLAVSLTGRDAGKIYLIYSANISQVSLVDGDVRRIINPKNKNLKHIKILDVKSDKIAQKIEQKVKIFDSEIFSFIKNYKND